MPWKSSEQYQNSTVSEISGSSGEVTISLFNLPIHHSTYDQLDYLAGRDIAPFILEEIFQTWGKIAFIKGFRHHSYHCFNCSKEINMSGKRPQSFQFTLTYKKFTPFTVKMTLPAVTCSNCGLVNGVLTKDQDIEVGEAIENALNSRGIQYKKQFKK